MRKVDGRRVRSFREAVALLTETDWADGWPVRGPRTLRWVLELIGENSTHPLAHHGRFRQLVGLPASDPGMQEHERAMRILEISIVYDQLQAGELARLELVARAAQLVELRHRDRVCGVYAGNVDEDAHLYVGTGRTRGLLCVSPELEAHVATELAKETATLKERRKAREESVPKANNQRPGKGGAGKE